MTDINKKYYDYDKGLKPVYVDEVIMGNVLQAGQGQNPARQAMTYAGYPEETNAFTINKVCASGMKAIALAAQSIKAGDAEIVVAGGMENMSNVPYALADARWGFRMDMPFGKVTDLMVHDGLGRQGDGLHAGGAHLLDREHVVETFARYLRASLAHAAGDSRRVCELAPDAIARWADADPGYASLHASLLAWA